MTSNEITSREQIESFHNKVHREANAIISYFIIGYFLIGVCLSFFNSTWSIGLIDGILNVVGFYILRSKYEEKTFFRIFVSLIMTSFVMQFMYQMEFMFAIYLFYFVSLTVLLFYEDWRVFIIPAIFPIFLFSLHYIYKHTVTSALEDQGSSDVAEVVDILMPIESIIIGLLVSILYVAICIIWAKQQRKQTHEAAVNQVRMKQQLNLMDTNIEFADHISQGNLKADYHADQADRLGQSLMNMRESLLEASERESKEKFVNVGLASIGELLRNNSDNLVELCDKVIEKLVNYMTANQGGIFIINEDENTDERYLELAACRAYDRKKYFEKRFEIGQGLVGQAAIEMETIYLLDIPDNYLNITSGLGLATPKSLLIVPLKANEDIVGVIEMASFEEFSPTDIEFLEKVGESIASTVITAKTNQTTKELLEQSRQMTEEMKAQEEEMRQNMEEMQATQEEMARTQRELAAKEANLNALINNTTDSIITIDRDYVITVMNDVQKDRYKGTQYEGMQEGANALDALGSVREEWKGYYDRAMAGERLAFTLKSSVRGEDTWREYFINPIKESSGNIIGASIFSRDTTEKTRMELELKKKGHVLEAMINSDSNTYFAIDADYRVILANEVLKKRFAEQGTELKPGDNILERMDGETKKTWKERYDRALSGERFVVEEPRETKDGTLYLRANCDPIKNDDGEVIGASVVSRNVTERIEALKKVEKLTAEINQLKNK